MNGIFSNKHDHSKTLEAHLRRLTQVKKSVDNELNEDARQLGIISPRKITQKSEKQQKIARENLALAKRIFHIMEGESEVGKHINNTQHLDVHPGTMNFKARLQEAQRIHNENMLMASRLETVRPNFRKCDLRKQPDPRRKAKDKAAKDKEKADKDKRKSRGQTAPGLTSRSDIEAGSSHGAPNSARVLYSEQNTGNNNSSNNNDKDNNNNKNNNNNNSDSSNNINNNSSNNNSSSSSGSKVLLEYTKVQNGRVLDVVVMKEPFRDRFAIFGIDVDDQQRYDLRLSSDAVSSILDGDILVTSLDNVEVWMALLNKVVLNKVQTFGEGSLDGEAEAHGVGPSYDNSNFVPNFSNFPSHSHNNAAPGQSAVDGFDFAPSKPDGSRPSASRGGSRGGRAPVPALSLDAMAYTPAPVMHGGYNKGAHNGSSSTKKKDSPTTIVHNKISTSGPPKPVGAAAASQARHARKHKLLHSNEPALSYDDPCFMASPEMHDAARKIQRMVREYFKRKKRHVAPSALKANPPPRARSARHTSFRPSFRKGNVLEKRKAPKRHTVADPSASGAPVVRLAPRDLLVHAAMENFQRLAAESAESALDNALTIVTTNVGMYIKHR